MITNKTLKLSLKSLHDFAKKRLPDQELIDLDASETDLGLPAIHRAQAGLIADMDHKDDVLYNRVTNREERSALAGAER